MNFDVAHGDCSSRRRTASAPTLVNTIAPSIVRNYDILDPADLDVEVRYVVRGVPMSGWLGAPFRFDLRIDNPGFDNLRDGVHDLTIEARGADRMIVKPLPAFVHISRDTAAGEPYGYTASRSPQHRRIKGSGEPVIRSKPATTGSAAECLPEVRRTTPTWHLGRSRCAQVGVGFSNPTNAEFGSGIFARAALFVIVDDD